MRPILFKIGSFYIYSWGVMLAVGCILGTILAIREGRRRGLDLQLLVSFILYALIAGLIGARLIAVLFYLDHYLDRPLEIITSTGGLSIHGGILAGILLGIWFSRRYGIPFWRLADTLAPSAILGQAIGRIGCLLGGHCSGVTTDLPWAIYLEGAYRHPTQIYQAVLNGIIFAILMRLRWEEKYDGYLFLVYAMLYSIARFFVEFYRADMVKVVGPFTAAQLASLGVIAGALTIMSYLAWRHAMVRRTS